VGKWLAGTWEGTATKAIAGAALGALLSWLTTSDIHPLIVGIGAAVIPVATDLLNRDDYRMGLGKRPHIDDLAVMPELEIEGE
jgi:hypothetical protein